MCMRENGRSSAHLLAVRLSTFRMMRSADWTADATRDPVRARRVVEQILAGPGGTGRPECQR
jgi:hypothetical protein